jgi:hypothetical protein
MQINSLFKRYLIAWAICMESKVLQTLFQSLPENQQREGEVEILF